MSKVIMPDPTPWFLMTQKETLDAFARLPGAFSDGKGQKRFVYIDGSRPDKALLVAHSDTIFNDERKIKVAFSKDVFFSGGQGGIGADDRAGCAILWELQKLGHSILVTSGEESGCVASHWIIEDKFWRQTIGEHKFAVQFDRRGSTDLIFYSVGTKDFSNYVEKEMGKPYKFSFGSFTDICILCKDICGVNISTGYYFEHSNRECLIYSQWLRTLYHAWKWLSKPSLPKFALEKKIWERDSNIVGVIEEVATAHTSANTIVGCNTCGKQYTASVWSNRAWICPSCGGRFGGG